MTALIDARPPGLDALYRPGNQFSVAMTWPAGALVGRTFTATLDAASLTVGVVGDVMTVTASEAQTAAAAESAVFTLTETTGGLDQVLIAGTWSPSDRAAASSTVTVTVTDSAASVDVTVTPTAASAEVAHDWAVDGWTPFTAITMTDDAPQAFAQSVANGKGVLTATQASGGGLRVAYAREGTLWADSEITTPIVGPTDWAATNAQQGHIHRVREVSPGLWEGIAVWTSVFGGDYGTLLINGVRWDGTTLFQATAGSATADQPYIDRTMRVRSRSRVNFGGVIQSYEVIENANLADLIVGDIIDITSLADASYNEAAIAIAQIDTGQGTISVFDPASGPNDAAALAVTGKIQPTQSVNQKRWCPYVLSSRVVGGSDSSVTVEVMRYKPQEGRPDWSDTRVQRATLTPTVDVPSLATEPGLCALWGAHFIDGSSGAFGSPRFRQVGS